MSANFYKCFNLQMVTGAHGLHGEHVV